MIDEALTRNNHVNVVAKKIAKSIGVIKRIAHKVLLNIRLNLYYTMVSPYLTYGNLRSPKTVLYLIVVVGEQPSRGMPGGAMPLGVKVIG